MHFFRRVPAGLRHRHLLAVPVAVAAIGLSVAGALLEPSVAETEGTPLRIVQPDLVIQAEEGAAVGTDGPVPALDAGEAVVLAASRATLRVADARVDLLSGAASVALQAGVLTVASLDAAVLVEVDGQTALIPPGRQWRLMEPEMAPAGDWDRWLADRETLPVPAETLGTLRDRASALRQVPRVAAAELSSDERTWLLALVHPATRERAWLLPPLERVSQDAQLLSQLWLPHADLQAEPASDALRRRYRAAVQEVARTSDIRFQAAYGGFLARVQGEMRERSLPDRAAFYGSVRAELLGEQATGASRSSVASGPSSSAASSICLRMEDTEALQVTLGLLARLGAQRTVKTAVDLTGEGTVRVEAMAFPGASGDRLLSFTIDPGCGRVEAIRLNGQVMPNGLTTEEFAAWVRGDGSAG